MAKAKVCPFAIRMWSADRQYKAGCFFVEGYCDASPKCPQIENESKRKGKEILDGSKR